MNKDNYVKIFIVSNGWQFKELVWQTKGHFWQEVYCSLVYDTPAAATAQAQAYADGADMEFRR